MTKDAKWLAEQVLLPELKEIKKEQKAQGKCLTDIKVNMEKGKGRMELIERDIQDLKEDCDEHKSDKSIHYNPYYSESLGEKLKRKKEEVIITAGSGGVIGTLLVIFKDALMEALK